MQAAGRLSSAYTTGWLISAAGARPVLLLMMVFPLLIAVASCLVQEDSAPPLSRRSSDNEVPPPDASLLPASGMELKLRIEVTNRNYELKCQIEITPLIRACMGCVGRSKGGCVGK